jgi:hypothetical protein
MANGRIYKRLPGFGISRLIAQRLWLGPDHLLVVSSQYLTERYKRFYFQDIQALTVTRSTKGVLMSVIFAIVGAFFALWAILGYTLIGWDPIPTAIVGGIAIFWVLLLLVNVLLGPTCRCYLYTAVNCEELYAVGRWRTAQRMLHRLRPLIESAQGGRLSDVHLDELGASQGSVYTSAVSDSTQPIAPARRDQALRQESGAIHAGLFAALILDAAVSLIVLIRPEQIPMPLSLIMLVLVIGLTVGALIRQMNSTLPRPLRNVTWVTFIYVCLIVTFFYAVTFINQIGVEMGGEDLPPEIETLQVRLRQIMSAIAVAFDVLLSVFGLRILWDYRNRSGQAAASAAPPAASAPEQE